VLAEKCEGDINSGWGGELSSGILNLRGGKNGGLLPSEECLVLCSILLSLILHQHVVAAISRFKQEKKKEPTVRRGT